MVCFLIPRRRAWPALLMMLATLGTAVTSPVAAVTVQGATYGELATAQVGRVPHSHLSHRPTTVTLSITKTAGSATSTEIIARAPQPNLSTYGAVTGRGAASGETSMSYYFQVVGPQPVNVPVIITASGTLAGATAKITSFAKAEIITNLGAFVYPVDDACPKAAGATSFCGSYTAPVTENIMASTKEQTAGPNVVELFASTSISKPGSASGSLGLTLEIDPSFPDASKYHLVISKGVGNPAAGLR
jgi:hypothetical protein